MVFGHSFFQSELTCHLRVLGCKFFCCDARGAGTMFKQQHVSTGKVGTNGTGSPLINTGGGGVVDATALGPL